MLLSVKNQKEEWGHMPPYPLYKSNYFLHSWLLNEWSLGGSKSYAKCFYYIFVKQAYILFSRLRGELS
jgi:hypothetical protein